MRRAGAAFVSAAIFVVPSAFAQTVLAPTILRSANLPSNAVKTFTVACPGGYVAASGGLTSTAPGIAVLRAEPAGTGAFAFRLGNPAGNPVRRALVAVACRRLRTRSGGSASFKLKPLRPRSLVVSPGAVGSAALTCPSETLAAGAGVDLAPSSQRGTAGFTGTRLSVRRIMAGLRGFAFAIRNSGGAARRVVLSGNCITVVSKPGARREQLRVNVTTFKGLVRPGRRSITRRCPRGWFSLASGYSLPASSLALQGSAAVAGGGRWTVVNAGDDSTRLVLQLVCGRVAAGR
jgi:hypothetical protein